ncbi:MAG TPA: hypothetical protein PKG63_06210 [Bacteroidales bacterium]|nr:hypothetical protein [Bacteroidales bacterium]
MKYLLLISSFIIINTVFSQNQNRIEKTFSNIPEVLDMNTLLKNKGQKSQTWNWDTIITYDTLGPLQRL